MREKIAGWITGYPWIYLGLILAITAFFGWGIRTIEIKTIFSELFPANQEFVKVFRDHPNFGNPLTVQIMVKVKDGTIFNPATLAKVAQLTRDIDLAPAVDHDQVISISTEKARYAEATPFGIESFPLMSNQPPSTPQEVAEFIERVEKAPGVTRFMISPDGSATLIQATFIEHRLDYGQVFQHVQNMVEQARDANHDVYAAGEPMLIGWVYHYESQMIYIFAVTITLMLLALAFYMRNVAGTLTPIIVAAIGAVWGFGLVAWLGINVEPLILVVPLLLVARAFSHAVQMTERYYELLYELNDKKLAAYHSMRLMMVPGVLGIITDMLCLYLIALAPIPMMQKFALFCGWWATALIPTNALLTPVILLFMPTPRNVDMIVGHPKGIHLVVRRLLVWLSHQLYGRRAVPTTAILVVLTVLAGYEMSQIQYGNIQEGSSLLKPEAEYNVAVGMLNNNFPGMNTLELIFEGKEPKAMPTSDAVRTMLQIQRTIETMPEPPTATLSYADYLPEAYRLFSGGNPKWLPLDQNDQATQAAGAALLFGASPKNYGHVVSYDLTDGTVSLWYRDRTEETLARAISQARTAIDQVGAEHEQFRIRLGSGTVALQKAVNDTVQRYEWIILAALVATIFISVTFAYRSPVAGFLLLVPVNLANLFLSAVMVLMGIGLDVNTLPIASIGIGVGIDYGIYLLSRICEEYQSHRSWEKAIQMSLPTTGKAIFFTATVVLVGILPWYFMSDLKFLADMGLLLVLIMLINMVLSLVAVPLLVWWIKPKFVTKENLIFKETLDIDEAGNLVVHSGKAAGE